jgi:hypothetical protein
MTAGLIFETCFQHCTRLPLWNKLLAITVMIVCYRRFASSPATWAAAAFVSLLLVTGCQSKSEDQASHNQAAQELQQLHQANQELQKLRSENQDLARLQRENQELKRLQPLSAELPKLRQENEQLRAQLQALKPAPKGR